jgi:hypothetical protein
VCGSRHSHAARWATWTEYVLRDQNKTRSIEGREESQNDRKQGPEGGLTAPSLLLWKQEAKPLDLPLAHHHLHLGPDQSREMLSSAIRSIPSDSVDECVGQSESPLLSIPILIVGVSSGSRSSPLYEKQSYVPAAAPPSPPPFLFPSFHGQHVIIASCFQSDDKFPHGFGQG